MTQRLPCTADAHRFNMTYVDEENNRQRPIMIHRAIFGSIERFFGILIENYAGAFPLWMAPTQVSARCVRVRVYVCVRMCECV
jgi:threonyl-tRNA synthetase